MKTSYDLLFDFSERRLVFYDTETCGLHSMMVLLQFAVGKEGDIHLYEIWKEPVGKTLDLIEAMVEHVLVGFNLSFDHFHLQKIHSIWSMLDREWIPEDHIEDIIAVEMDARDQPCLKAFSAIDLLLHSRRGPYQSLMARKDIRIKSIPLNPVQWNGQMIPLAYAVSSYLEQTVELDGIYFARTADKDAPHWAVQDRVNDEIVDREFADVVLRFNADGSLKSLAEHALGLKPKAKFKDIELNKKYRPIELGYAPFAKSVSTAEKNWEVWGLNTEKTKEVLKGYAWPGVIQLHIDHWHLNEPARLYAEDDITYTRGLYYHFDEPEPGDRDSILACMVASVRWHGFEIDLEGIAELKRLAEEVVAQSPINTNKPPHIRMYVNEMCDEVESSFLEETTKKAKLEEMSQWIVAEDEECFKCMAGLEPDCLRCGGTGTLKKGIHPAALRAEEVLGIKIAKKEIELYNKLLIAGRFHASFRVTGTLSNRMAGGDGLNAQGINHDPMVRKQFPLAWAGYELCGGDFDSFEVTIADAVYNDLDLRTAIVTGQKLHGLFGTLLYPGYTYEQILDSDHNPDNYEFGNMYTKAKSGVFAMIYGGNASTLNRNLGIPEDVAELAFAEWGRMFPGIGNSRKRIIENFQPLQQPEGLGKAIHWVEPLEYVESFLGFRRYFTLEYKIVRALFDLARNLPAEWRTCDAPVIRSDRRGVQKAWGALTSALYGAAFGIAEGVVRASANHEIQSPGAEVTKETQVRIWGLQPHGVHEWIVAPMNVHDEVISVTHPDYVQAQADIVEEVVESYRPQVPLIGMSWCLEMNNWAEKKGGDGNMLHVTYDKPAMIRELERGAKVVDEVHEAAEAELLEVMNSLPLT